MAEVVNTRLILSLKPCVVHVYHEMSQYKDIVPHTYTHCEYEADLMREREKKKVQSAKVSRK